MDAQFSELLKNSSPNAVLVNDLSEIDHLYKEFKSSVSQVDELCEKIDSDATPFKSKYEARNILEGLFKKMEATRTIAMMEQKSTIARDLDWRVASLRVRLATIDWDVEEPHNTEIELELASQYYFHDLYDNIMKETKKQNVGDDDETDEGLSISSLNVEAAVPQLPSTYGHSTIPFERMAVDVIKCLNLSGILWAGRGQVKRSFMFLHSSYNVYKTCFDIKENNNYNNNTNITVKSVSTNVLSDIESIHTLTLFYLAQAYAHLKDVKKSSLFCHETLQRQFDSKFFNIKSAMEWIKNCLGMSDYCLSRNLYKHGLCTILSCERVYEKYIKQQHNNTVNSILTATNSSVESDPDVLELKGDIYKKFIQLDTKLMREAFETEIRKNNEAIDNPDTSIWAANKSKSSSPASGSSNEAEDINDALNKLKFIHHDNNNNHHNKLSYEHFKGLPITIPIIKVPTDIIDFDTARQVYLRAVSKIETTKLIFPLDGCVTDHIGLLLNHSKLYHYLAVFETDLKRKFTMENRRIDMLLPMITTLSRTAYEGLHKNISYELAEAYMTLHDIKMDLLKEKSKTGTLEINTLKKMDIQKCNEFCRLGIAMFTHFASFYQNNSSSNNNSSDKIINSSSGATVANLDANDNNSSNTNYLSMNVEELDNSACWNPDPNKLSADELRPFFNCHFLSARLYSKVIVPSLSQSTKAEKARGIVASLKRYEWLTKNCVKICQEKNVSCDDIFGVELQVCRDMAQLLPSKIDRIHYLDEKSFSL